MSSKLNEIFPDIIGRLYNRDASLWSSDPAEQAIIADRLGWIDVAGEMLSQVYDIKALIDRVRSERYKDVILLGMGGSSLCPAVLWQVFGVKTGFLDLHVMDTTDPAAIIELEKNIELSSTLFIVASKSGTTVETLSQFKYFWQQMTGADNKPGRHFIAITDTDTPLAVLAKEKGFRAIFINPSDIGGRYSALSYFGLVPAAFIGIDLEIFLGGAVEMAELCREEGQLNPMLELGTIMAEQARAGRDKMTLVTSPEYIHFGSWVEQLVAESTGKHGKGLIPIIGEEPAESSYYGDDRFFILMLSAGEGRDGLDFWKNQIRRAGFTVLEIELDERYDLGKEFWRWEAAVAVCGALLGINPFDEPNVAESKANTSRLLKELEFKGVLPTGSPAAETDQLSVRYGTAAGEKIEQAADMLGVSLNEADSLLKAFFSLAGSAGYISLLAYWPETPATTEVLTILRKSLTRALRLAGTIGFGPRYLHSTGQEHKGGPEGGIYIQLTVKEEQLLEIPGEPYSFGQLERAQAVGDFEALNVHGRPVMEIELKSLNDDNLRKIEKLFIKAISTG